MNYKTCLRILLFAIYFAMSLVADNSKSVTFEVQREKAGDIITILDSDIKCSDIQRAENNARPSISLVNSDVCKCSTKTPIFNVFLNHTYGCYHYKTFCQHQDCIERFGSYKRNELTIDANVTRFLHDAGLTRSIGVTCRITELIRNTFEWNHSRWESISTNENVNMIWPKGKPVEILKTQSGKELSGKLILFKIWCPKQQNPKTNHVMIILAGKETFTLTPSTANAANAVSIVVAVIACIVVVLLVLLTVFKKKKKKKKKKVAKKENIARHPPSEIDGNKSFSNGMYAEANSTCCEVDVASTLKIQHRPQHESYDAQYTEPAYAMTESKDYQINQHKCSSLDTAKQEPEHYQALNLNPPVGALESQYQYNHTVDSAEHEEPVYFETEKTYYEAGIVLGKNQHHSETEKAKMPMLDEYAVIDKLENDNDRLSVEDEYSVVENPNKSREVHNNITGSLNNSMENQESYEYNYAYEKHHRNNIGKAGASNDSKLGE